MTRNLCLALIMLLPVAFFGVPVRADSELFPSTEVTAHYNIWGWIQQTLLKKPADKAVVAEVEGKDIALDMATLAAIEPAAGHEDAATESAPRASGKTEGQKSFTGKVIGAPPPLPTVTIGGKAIISLATSVAADVAETTPDGLKGATFADFLERRYSVTPYAHSPQRGDLHAPVTVVQFVDLSCGQCMPELAKIDAVMLDYASSTLVTHIHAPTAKFQDTNMPAFYGKLAAKAGIFWAYRDNVIKDKPVDANAIFDELIKSGVTVIEARGMMMTDARRFYRELDADALLARSFGVTKPPVLFVNGIRVGESGIPLEKLPDVMQYVTARIKRGLQEPPK